MDIKIDELGLGKIIEGKIGKRTVKLAEVENVLAGGLDRLIDFPRREKDIRLLYRVNPVLAKQLVCDKTWVWKGFDGAFVGLAFPGPHMVYSMPKMRRLLALNQEPSSEELEASLEESLDWVVENNMLIDVPEFHCPIYLDA